MKTLLINLAKGGVGKSMLVGQLSRYARALGLKVLVIDMDEQANQTNALVRMKTANPLPWTITEVMVKGLAACEESSGKAMASVPPGFDVLMHDESLIVKVVEPSHTLVERNGETMQLASAAHANFVEFLSAASSRYDLCVIDTPPQYDVRVLGPMSAADYVLSPMELAQESIEGMALTLNGPRGIQKVKGYMNPKLTFLGFLPNKVKATPSQKAAMQELTGKAVSQYMFRHDDGTPAILRDRQAYAEAQAQGLSLKELGKTSSQARETWQQARPVFDLILRRMELLGECRESV